MRVYADNAATTYLSKTARDKLIQCLDEFNGNPNSLHSDGQRTQEALDEVEVAADGDVAYIQDKGTLVVGITDFAPMDYKDENGEWIGFDADMAKLVAEKLGVEIEFIVIDWDNKVFELDGKGIDVVWNGMTLTDAVVAAMECTNAYCNNAQVVVTAK